jgi:hypothetical protein
MALLLKALFTVLGILLMLAGVAIAPLPGPMGLPLVLLGLILILRTSVWARRGFVKLSKRYPKWLGPVRRALRKRAKILAIMWHQMLRTERFFGRGRLHVLKGFRRLFRRRPMRRQATARPVFLK